MTINGNKRIYYLIPIILFLYVLGLLGCRATTSIATKINPTYNNKIKRVFVISNISSSLGNSTAKDFEQSILSELRSNNIQADIATVLELDIDINLYKERLNEFNPDTILTIKDIGGTKNERGIIIDVLFDVLLIDKSDIIIWRANVKFIKGDSEKDDGFILAKDIFGKLKEDGII